MTGKYLNFRHYHYFNLNVESFLSNIDIKFYNSKVIKHDLYLFNVIDIIAALSFNQNIYFSLFYYNYNNC